MLIDLHVNFPAVFDSTAFANLLQKVKESGLDGIAYMTGKGFEKKEEALSIAREHNLRLFFGTEVNTKIGSLLFFPANADKKFFDEDWNSCALNADENEIDGIIKKFHSAGGVIVAFHPYCRGIEPCLGDKIFNLREIDAIEILNRGSSRTQNDLALEASHNMKVAAVGGSGIIKDPADVGHAATLFLSDMSEQSEFTEAIGRGDVWAVEILSPDAVRYSEFDDRRERRRSYGNRDRGERGERRRGSGFREDRGRRGRGRSRDRDDD
jgi:hypothetical protein